MFFSQYSYNIIHTAFEKQNNKKLKTMKKVIPVKQDVR